MRLGAAARSNDSSAPCRMTFRPVCFWIRFTRWRNSTSGCGVGSKANITNVLTAAWLMSALTSPFDAHAARKTLRGASEMPLGESVSTPVLSAIFKDHSHRLEQLVAVRACGLVHGPNGVGKTLLVEQLMRTLPEKRFK